MGVDATTYLADAKNIYGAIQDQVSTLPAFMNLLDNGPMNDPVSNIGIRGYTFLARLAPNWNMGYRAEGTSGVGTAGNQGLAQSTVSLKYAYVPITITGQAENLTKGNEKAFMQAKALEAKFDMKDIVSHVNVVMVGAQRGGQLAQVDAPASGSFTADNSSLLPGALFLRVGQLIDTNAVGGGALTISAATITAINYTTRVVTVPGTAVQGEAVTLSGEAALTTGAFPLTAEDDRRLSAHGRRLDLARIGYRIPPGLEPRNIRTSLLGLVRVRRRRRGSLLPVDSRTNRLLQKPFRRRSRHWDLSVRSNQPHGRDCHHHPAF